MAINKQLSILFVLLLSPALLSAQYIGNMSFDIPSSNNSPIGWEINNPGQSCKLDNTQSLDSTFSLVMNGEKPQSYAYVYQTIEVADKVGQEVTLSGMIKTMKPVGWSGLYLRAYNETEALAFDNMENNPVKGRSDWQEYQIKLTIPAGTEKLSFGAYNNGTGDVWFDDLSLEFNGVDYPYEINYSAPTDSTYFLSDSSKVLLAEHLKPISLSGGHGQFAFIDSIFQAAKIVSIGGVSYGANEIFALKAQITKHLFAEGQYKLLATESTLPESYVVNEALESSSSDLNKALNALRLWTYNTDEVVELLNWMREQNSSGSADLAFAGYDMQYYQKAIKELQDVEVNNYTYQQYLKDVTKLFELKSKLSEKEVVDAQNLIVSIREFLNKSNSVFDRPYIFKMVDIIDQFFNVSSSAQRQEYMAQNIKWLFNYERKRPVIWGNNENIQESGEAFGKLISEEMGPDNYLSIGFMYYGGEHNAVGRGLRAYEAVEAPEGSYEHYFEQVGEEIFLLDLRSMDKNNSMNDWLFSPAYFRNIGARYKSQQFYISDLSEAFDMVIFIKEVSPSQLNR